MKKTAIQKIALFEGVEVRRVWEDERWFFCVNDVVIILTDSKNPTEYVKKLRKRDIVLSQVWGEITRGVSMPTAKGNQKLTSADTVGILRIIQSIPSPKAEPFKAWLAKIGNERIEEINDPELAARRMRRLYKDKGYDEAWIEQRERGIATRNALTEEWHSRGATRGRDYGILTNEIYQAGFDLSTKEYRKVKNISRHQNLRDSMSNLELALTNLGEATATELHRKNNSQGVPELVDDAKSAGNAIKTARMEIEKELGSPVVSEKNFRDLTRKKELADNMKKGRSTGQV